MPRSHRFITPARTLAWCLALAFAWPGLVLADTARFEINAEPLSVALKAFAKQAHMQLLYEYDVVRDVRGNPVVGVIEKRVALQELVRNTGLEVVFTSDNAATIRPILAHLPSDTPKPLPKASNVKDTDGKKHDSHSAVQMEQMDRAGPAKPPTTRPQQSKRRVATLQEVVVTGTHIAGVGSIASPVTTYSKEYLSAGGASDIGEAIQQLPQNFSEATEMNAAVVPSGPGNTLNDDVGAVGFDIHGLGPQSSLVLINGHRIAAGNTTGNFTDVSLLPLGAIDHIDIVEDSAGAIYGSDAVGGVVNIVMTPKFDGSDTRARYGRVTEGGRTETTVSETAGTSWSNGSAVVSYDYGDETPLQAADRTFSNTAPSPFSLLPEQVSDSAYGSITETLPSDLTLTGFVIYGHRSMEDSYFFAPFTPTESVLDASTVDTYTFDVDAQKTVSSWGLATASLEYSSNDSHHMAFIGSETRTPGEYNPFGNSQGHSRLKSADLGFSGHIDVLKMHGLRYAIGAQIREEGLSYNDYLAKETYTPSRTITAEYAELLVPLGRHVTLDAAGRSDRYSDVGSTTNPKVGLQWKPNDSVALGATYSTAFLAPPLYDLNPVPAQGAYLRLVDPLKAGPCVPVDQLPEARCTAVLSLVGGNANLKPQTAKTETVRIALHPMRLPGLRASLSFYDIKYYNLINNLAAYVSFLNSLTDEGPLGTSIVQRNVPNQVIQALAQTVPPGGFFNFGEVNPGTVTTFVDQRDLNLSQLSTRGLDIDVSYRGHLAGVAVLSELSGVRILQYRTQFGSGTPSLDVLNTAFNPLSLKLRERESIVLGYFSASVFANYTGAYTNTYVTPPTLPAPVASWLTIDAQATYMIPLGVGDRGASITLGCLNVADRHPPYVADMRFPINFDGANATPLGRFLYAEVKLRM